MAEDAHYMSVRRMSGALRARELSAVALADVHLRRPPPGDGPPRLLGVYDTQKELDCSRPNSRENTAVTPLAAQSPAQAIFDAKGLVPTYVVDYPVATSGLVRETLAPWAAAGRCLIGAHLHPWVNPPFEEAVSAHLSYPGNLPAALERAKLESLTRAIEETFGRRPDIYKAGRYGLGADSTATLEALGYRIDMSVVPYSDFGDDGGPDFTAFDFRPFWFGSRGGLLAIPLACGLHGRLQRQGPPLYPARVQPAGPPLPRAGHFPGPGPRDTGGSPAECFQNGRGSYKPRGRWPSRCLPKC